MGGIFDMMIRKYEFSMETRQQCALSGSADKKNDLMLSMPPTLKGLPRASERTGKYTRCRDPARFIF